jgi:TorA maturation chaperone TorD
VDASARARLYAFLSRLIVRELDEAFVHELVGPFGRALLPSFAASKELDLVTSAAWRAVELDVDFANLTMVNVVPYESFFRRDDGMIEAGGGNAMVTFLRKYGFEADLAIARSLSPDHLGIGLELMSLLCGREATAEDVQARESARRVQRELLVDHLMTWAPIFLLAMRRNARTVIYRDVADATLHLLHQHLEALES